MSKRNITYVKPQDPSFLAKLKAQIGYKEGPTVDTKRQKLEEDCSDGSGGEERPEHEDEKPQVVVLESGDLTAEEVAQEEKRIAREAAETRADLSQPIVFRKRKAKDTNDSNPSTALSTKSKSRSKSKESSKSKLSFNTEEDEGEGEYDDNNGDKSSKAAQ